MGNALDLDTHLACWETTAQKVERAFSAHQGSICFTYGLLACFCGQHFTYSLLFWQSYRHSRWRRTKRTVGDVWSRLRAATRVAKEQLPDGLPTFQEASGAAQHTVARLQAMQESFIALQHGDSAAGEKFTDELQGLQANLGLAQQLGNAATATLTEIQPKRLLELALDLRQLFFENISAALSCSAHMVGLSANVGDATAKSVNHFAEHRIQALVDSVVARSGEELTQLKEDPNAGKWIRGAISAVSCSLGLVVSFYIDSLVLPFVNARLGAELIAGQLFSTLTRRGLCWQPPVVMVLGVEWFLCAGGLYFQLVLGTGGSFSCILCRFFFGTPKLAAFARLALSIPLLAESWLRSAVAAHRLGLVGPTKLITDAAHMVSATPEDNAVERDSGMEQSLQDAPYNLD